MRQMNIKVAPGKVMQIGAVGDYVRVKDASVAVRIESPDRGEFLQMEAGDAAILSRFNRLNISHDDVAEQDVSLLIGDGTRSESSTVHRLIGSIAVDAAGPMVSGAFNSATAGALLMLNENLNRRYLMITNSHSSTDHFFGFTNAVGSAIGGGVRLAPGQSIIFDSFVPTSEIWVNTTGSKSLYWVEG